MLPWSCVRQARPMGLILLRLRSCARRSLCTTPLARAPRLPSRGWQRHEASRCMRTPTIRSACRTMVQALVAVQHTLWLRSAQTGRWLYSLVAFLDSDAFWHDTSSSLQSLSTERLITTTMRILRQQPTACAPTWRGVRAAALGMTPLVHVDSASDSMRHEMRLKLGAHLLHLCQPECSLHHSEDEARAR